MPTKEQLKEFFRTYRFFNQRSEFRSIVGEPGDGVQTAIVVRRIERERLVALRTEIDGDDLTIYMPAHDAIALASELQRCAGIIDPDYSL